jgi:hypothetical protein
MCSVDVNTGASTDPAPPTAGVTPPERRAAIEPSAALMLQLPALAPGPYQLLIIGKDGEQVVALLHTSAP